MFKKLKFWLRRNKGCKGFCLTCPYYEQCKYELDGQ